jgi:hypothetical protein
MGRKKHRGIRRWRKLRKSKKITDEGRKKPIFQDVV